VEQKRHVQRGASILTPCPVRLASGSFRNSFLCSLETVQTRQLQLIVKVSLLLGATFAHIVKRLWFVDTQLHSQPLFHPSHSSSVTVPISSIFIARIEQQPKQRDFERSYGDFHISPFTKTRWSILCFHFPKCLTTMNSTLSFLLLPAMTQPPNPKPQRHPPGPASRHRLLCQPQVLQRSHAHLKARKALHQNGA